MKPGLDWHLEYYYHELLTSKRERKELADGMRNWMPPSHVNPDKDTSAWTSALGMYTLTFHKEEATLLYSPGLFHYVITLTITDNIGLEVFSIKFSENDAVSLIINILSKMYDISEYGGVDTPNFMMKMNRNANMITDTVMIDVRKNEDFPYEVEFKDSLYFHEEYYETRDIEFVISYYNKATGTIMNSVMFPVCSTEVYEILDSLIVILEDVDLPSDQQDMLSDAMCYIYDT